MSKRRCARCGGPQPRSKCPRCSASPESREPKIVLAVFVFLAVICVLIYLTLEGP